MGRTRRQIVQALERFLDEAPEGEDLWADVSDGDLRAALANFAEDLRGEPAGGTPQHVRAEESPLTRDLTDDELIEALEETARAVAKRGYCFDHNGLLVTLESQDKVATPEGDILLKVVAEREGYTPNENGHWVPPGPDWRRPEAQALQPPRTQPPIEPHPLHLEDVGEPEESEPEEPEMESTPRERARRERERREAEQHEEMSRLIERTHQRLDRQALLDWEREQKYQDEPIIGEIVWHEHGDPKE